MKRFKITEIGTGDWQICQTAEVDSYDELLNLDFIKKRITPGTIFHRLIDNKDEFYLRYAPYGSSCQIFQVSEDSFYCDSDSIAMVYSDAGELMNRSPMKQESSQQTKQQTSQGLHHTDFQNTIAYLVEQDRTCLIDNEDVKNLLDHMEEEVASTREAAIRFSLQADLSEFKFNLVKQCSLYGMMPYASKDGKLGFRRLTENGAFEIADAPFLDEP